MVRKKKQGHTSQNEAVVQDMQSVHKTNTKPKINGNYYILFIFQKSIIFLYNLVHGS